MRRGRNVCCHVDLLRSTPTFEELHDRVASLRIKHLGHLTVYDTAYRIGAKLGLEPQLVYLHQGTRVGAVLLGLGQGFSSGVGSTCSPPHPYGTSLQFGRRKPRHEG